jgi:hypothetical protein
MALVTQLQDIRQKVRRLTARPSDVQIKDDQIDDYINTFYLYDLPEDLQLMSNRVNYQFLTTANRAVYDLPNNLYLTGLPPVFIGGYQSYMTQSRENFYRINPSLNYLQQEVANGGDGMGNASAGPYSFILPNNPIMCGWKRNPPGAYSTSVYGTQSDVPANTMSWMVLISGPGVPDATSGLTQSYSLIDDGQGNLFDPNDIDTVITPQAASGSQSAIIGSRGTINYITGAVQIFGNGTGPSPLSVGFAAPIADGASINAQYVPYVASRPMSVVFYQQQFNLYPIPDQAYTVSFEAYALPTVLLNDTDVPNMLEWGQVLAYGAADKIFTDNGDIENSMKFRPYLEEQLKLIQRRTIVQQTPERVATIYTEQTGSGQFPFGNNFSGF